LKPSAARTSPLASRDFRLVLAAWGLSWAGDFLAVVALTLRVEQQTGSGFAVAALLVAAALPRVAFSPVAGWLVDRYETRTVLAVTAAAQAVVAVALAGVDGTAATIALAFALNCGFAIESPALFALIPRIVGEDGAPGAYAWFDGVKYAAFTGGVLLGGVLTGAFGASTALLVDAGTFAVTGLAALALHVRRAPRAHEERDGRMTAGLRVLSADRVLRLVLGVLAASVLFGGFDNVALVFFAKDDLGAGAAGYGALSAAWGVGMVGGAMLGGRRMTAANAALATVAAVASMGAAIVLTGAASTLALALVLLACGGVGNGVSNLGMRTLLQARVADAVRGRAYSGYQAAVTVADFAALAVGGALVELLGARATLVAAGAGCLLAGLAGLPALSSASAPRGTR
jgi:predicted MFS family arabinose efflux permease